MAEADKDREKCVYIYTLGISSLFTFFLINSWCNLFDLFLLSIILLLSQVSLLTWLPIASLSVQINEHILSIWQVPVF